MEKEMIIDYSILSSLEQLIEDGSSPFNAKREQTKDPAMERALEVLALYDKSVEEAKNERGTDLKYLFKGAYPGARLVAQKE